MAKWGTNSREIEETTSHKAGSSAVFNIAFEREGEKKLLQRGVFVFGHPSRYDLRRQGSILMSGRDVVPSLWYGDYERIFFKFLRWQKVTKREKSLILAGKLTSEILKERNENEKYYLFWWSDKKQGLRSVTLILFYCFGLSDEDDSVCRTDNFMTVPPLVFLGSSFIHLDRNFAPKLGKDKPGKGWPFRRRQGPLHPY